MNLSHEYIKKMIWPSLVRPKEKVEVTSCTILAPGATCGPLVFSPSRISEFTDSKHKPILVKSDSTLHDCDCLVHLGGIVLTSGGCCSHLAILAKTLGIPCVSSLDIELQNDKLVAGTFVVEEESYCSINGFDGEITWAKSEVVPPRTSERDRALRWLDEEERALQQNGLDYMSVFGNADTCNEVQRSFEFGACGIGGCRTEHMFVIGGELALLQRLITNPTSAVLGQCRDFLNTELTKLIEVLPVGSPLLVRLLDAPLNEFLFDEEPVVSTEEYNRRSYIRGCRLGLLFPDVYRTQIESIFESAITAYSCDNPVVLYIVFPFVSSENELVYFKKMVSTIAQQYSSRNCSINYYIGTMIEIPKAALIAERLARHVDCFVFGTNDLTHFLYASDRDDSTNMKAIYASAGIHNDDPFEKFDESGIGYLIDRALEKGREVNPFLLGGVCGEIASEPESVKFFTKIGMDFISCVPSKIPEVKLSMIQESTNSVKK